MAVETFMLAGGLAVVLGVIAARMMRVIGLALLLSVVVAAGVARIVMLFSHPSLVECLMLLALIQAGYLLGTIAISGPETAEARWQNLSAGAGAVGKGTFLTPENDD